MTGSASPRAGKIRIRQQDRQKQRRRRKRPPHTRVIIPPPAPTAPRRCSVDDRTGSFRDNEGYFEFDARIK
jgi:hypothetical protein